MKDNAQNNGKNYDPTFDPYENQAAA